jgi:hypothetical protein
MSGAQWQVDALAHMIVNALWKDMFTIETVKDCARYAVWK